MRPTLLIIEKNELFRIGLRTAFDKTQLDVLADCVDLESALPIIRRHNPNVVMVDAEFQNPNELRVLADVLAVPGTRVLIWSDRLTTKTYQRLIAMGVVGGVEKSIPLDHLSDAIRAVASGEYHFTHSLHEQIQGPLAGLSSRGVGGSFQGVPSFSGSEKPDQKQLSFRESEVLSWLAEGFTNREIADRLLLSVKTVETYRARLMKKLQIRGQAELKQFVQTVY